MEVICCDPELTATVVAQLLPPLEDFENFTFAPSVKLIYIVLWSGDAIELKDPAEVSSAMDVSHESPLSIDLAHFKSPFVTSL